MSPYTDPTINSTRQIQNLLVDLMSTVYREEKINPNSLKSNTEVRTDIIYKTFLAILGDSFHLDEVLLLSGKQLTKRNCPQEYLPFVEILFQCKHEFKFDLAPKINQLCEASKEAHKMQIFHQLFEKLIRNTICHE